MRRRQPDATAVRRRLDLGHLARRFNQPGEHIPRSEYRRRAGRRTRRSSPAPSDADRKPLDAAGPETMRRSEHLDAIDQRRRPRTPDGASPRPRPSATDAARGQPLQRARSISPRWALRRRGVGAVDLGAGRQPGEPIGSRSRRCRRTHDYHWPGARGSRTVRPTAACAAGGRKRPASAAGSGMRRAQSAADRQPAWCPTRPRSRPSPPAPGESAGPRPGRSAACGPRRLRDLAVARSARP